VESGLLLDVVVGQGTAILELLAGEDQALLIRWDALLILDLALDVVDGVGTLNLECDLEIVSTNRRYGNGSAVRSFQ